MYAFTGQAPVAQAVDRAGPVFIGGLAHSGKTPLRLALDVQGDIAFSRRTYMWNRFYRRYGDLAVASNFERCLAAMLESPAIHGLCDDANVIRERFAQSAPTYARLFALFHEQNAQRQGKSRWGDQLGFVEQYADAIFEAYPAARMIHTVRDLRDSHAIAMQQARFRKGKVGWDSARWLCSVELAQRNGQRYPGQYRVVRFESLAAQPEGTLRELCDFLELTFDPAMVAPLVASTRGNASGKDRASDSDGNRQLGGQLSQRQLAFTQTYTRRQLQSFGYALQPASLSWRDRFLYLLVDWPINRAAMIAWQTVRRRSPHPWHGA